MKSLVVLSVFLAITFADKNWCPCKVADNYFLLGGLYGSIRPGLNGTGFYSIEGDYEEAIYYNEDTPGESMMMTNTSIVVLDGTTGKLITNGWTWRLATKEGFYVKSNLGGVVKPCKKHNPVLIPRMTNVVGHLWQIFPPPETGKMVGPPTPTGPPKMEGTPTATPGWGPTGSIICQGPIGTKDTGGILTVGFTTWGGEGKGNGAPRMTFSTWIRDTTCITTILKEIRPLGSNDANIFDNVCPKTTDETNQNVEMHFSFHEKFKELLPMILED